ncbi:MAG: hypothetical protein ACC660_00930 [Acidimicrobiales bacterium]
MRVEPWPDPVIDNLGHDPRSHYVELYWLGVLGPSTTWLLRRVADRFDMSPDGFDLDLHETAVSLGLGMREGRHSPFMRAIDRACQFGLARKRPTDTLLVRRRMPPVTQGQLKRLPNAVQRKHAEWQQAELCVSTEAEQKARRLALTLLEIGEDIDSAERQLCRWRIDGPVAKRALLWAHNRHSAALAATRSDGPDAA